MELPAPVVRLLGRRQRLLPEVLGLRVLAQLQIAPPDLVVQPRALQGRLALRQLPLPPVTSRTCAEAQVVQSGHVGMLIGYWKILE